MVNCRTDPGFDCGSDHNLVAENVKLRIGKSNNIIEKPTYSLHKLSQLTLENRNAIRIAKNFSVLQVLEEESSPDDMWELGRKAIVEAAEKVLGRPQKKIRKPWISESSVQLMERRQALKALKNNSMNDPKNYKEVSMAFQRQLGSDKQELIQTRCKDAENGLKRHDTRSAYRTVKELTNSFTSRQRNIENK